MSEFEPLLRLVLAGMHQQSLGKVNGRPWSLCELEVGDAGLEMLKDFFGALDTPTVQRCLLTPWRSIEHNGRNISHPSGFGLLFLLLAAEVARRQAREGEVWASVRSAVDWRRDAVMLLFVQNQPSYALREAMEQAALRFGLRHVFGREGVQAWLTTVYLQLGFTRRGFPERLPEWLGGHNQPRAIAHLLDAEDPDLHCPKFTHLWETLWQYRRGNLPTATFHQRLQTSPWTLSDWAEGLATAARAQIDRWDRVATPKGADQTPPGEDDATEPFFLSEPRLDWSGGVPAFTSEICNLEALGLTGSFYGVRVEGEVLARLTRQSDGCLAFSPSAELRVGAKAATLTAEMLDLATGTEPRSLELQCWDDAEEVNVFEQRTGRRLADAWVDRMVPDRDYVLLLSDDLEVHPAWTECWPCPLPPTGRRLWRVTKEQLQEGLEVQLEGETFWTPFLQTAPRRPGRLERVWLEQEPAAAAADGSFHLRLRGSTTERVRSARAGGLPLAIAELTPGWTRLGPLPFHRPGRLRVDLRLADAATGHARRGFAEVDVGLPGLCERGADRVWRTRPRTCALTVQEASTTAFSIAPPLRHGTPTPAAEWVLVEGGVHLGPLTRWTHTARPLGNMGGWGASLNLRRGLFNAPDDDELLAREVTDPGVFAAESHFEVENGWLQLRLRQEMKLSPEHTWVIWRQDGSTVRLSPAEDAALVDGNEMHLDFASERLPRAVALAYRGARVGAWWHGDWAQGLQNLSPEAARPTAALIRWLKLPILGNRWRKQVKDFARQFPAESLVAWLAEGELLPGLQPTPDASGWIASLRMMFWNSNVAPDSADLVLEALAENPVPELFDSVASACWRLHEISPLFMGHFLRAWLKQAGLNALGRTTLRALLEARFAQVPVENLGRYLADTKTRLLGETVGLMGAAEPFVESTLDRALAPLSDGWLADRDKHNLQLALNRPSFRRLLALHVVTRLFQ